MWISTEKSALPPGLPELEPCLLGTLTNSALIGRKSTPRNDEVYLKLKFKFRIDIAVFYKELIKPLIRPTGLSKIDASRQVGVKARDLIQKLCNNT